MSVRCEWTRETNWCRFQKVLERIPRFIDEVTRIQGVDLYVGVRTREKYYYGFAEWANKFSYLISSARKVLLAFEYIIGDQYQLSSITYKLFIIKSIYFTCVFSIEQILSQFIAD